MKVHLLAYGMTGCGLLVNLMPAGEFWLGVDSWGDLEKIAEDQGEVAERCLRCDEFFKKLKSKKLEGI